MSLDEFLEEYVQTYGFETSLIHPSGMQLWKAFAVNLAHTNSKIFDSVWKRECVQCRGEMTVPFSQWNPDPTMCPTCLGTGYIEPYKLMIAFARCSDHKWSVGIYSANPSIDCNAIAKSFGGGGNNSEAHFRCDELPFEY